MSTRIVTRPITLQNPLWMIAERLRGERQGVLLDSAAPGGGRSYLCAEPFLVMSAKRRRGSEGRARITLERPGMADDVFEDRPLDVLRKLWARYAIPPDADASFRAGIVGYIGYEAGHFIEALPDRGEDDLGMPDLWLAFVNAVVGHDHASGASWVSAIGRGPHAARDAERAADALLDRTMGEPPSAPLAATVGAVEGRFDEATYSALVERVREHIRAGDAFEVCLTHRLDALCNADPFALYRALRAANPAPFAGWIHTPYGDVLSSSPERFLRVGAGGAVETRPIKGTRPRGASPAEDRALRDALAASVKDRAENLMIVDLARSDLGRVARIGSVTVPELLAIEAHPTVHQMVSTVRAVLREGVGPVELIEACFPPGSMTGAPKIEAMKIIDRLEPLDRGPYSGALGWIDFSGTLDLAVVIRTIVLANGRATIGTGGAITIDSDPIAEHKETRLKAQAPIDALLQVSR